MWLIPRLTHDFVSVIFSQKHITAIVLKKNKNSSRYDIVAYENHELYNQTFSNIILNSSEYLRFIKNFLNKHNQHHAFIGFALTNFYVNDEYKAVSSLAATNESLGIAPTSNSTFGYQFAYNNSNGNAVFYTYRIPKVMVLQYMLLGLHIPVNLITITPQAICLVEAYKALKGSLLRQTEFMISMETNKNDITQCIPYDLLKEKINVPQSLSSSDNLEKIAIAYGLFRSQGFPL